MESFFCVKNQGNINKEIELTFPKSYEKSTLEQWCVPTPHYISKELFEIPQKNINQSWEYTGQHSSMAYLRKFPWSERDRIPGGSLVMNG